MREQSREQLDGAVTDEIFDAKLPSWQGLSASAREDKIALARDELLAVLDRAGYCVRRKRAQKD